MQRVVFLFLSYVLEKENIQKEKLEQPGQFQGLQVMYLLWCSLFRGVSLHTSDSFFADIPLVQQSERRKQTSSPSHGP